MKGSMIKAHGADKFHYRAENYPEVFRVFFFWQSYDLFMGSPTIAQLSAAGAPQGLQ